MSKNIDDRILKINVCTLKIRPNCTSKRVSVTQHSTDTGEHQTANLFLYPYSKVAYLKHSE